LRGFRRIDIPNLDSVIKASRNEHRPLGPFPSATCQYFPSDKIKALDVLHTLTINIVRNDRANFKGVRGVSNLGDMGYVIIRNTPLLAAGAFVTAFVHLQQFQALHLSNVPHELAHARSPRKVPQANGPVI
jgi:hypothetical protein